MSFALGATDTSGILNIDNNVSRPIPQTISGTQKTGAPLTMAAKTSAYTWAIDDCGVQIPVSTASGIVVITLPATVVLYTVWIYASATSSNALKISPNSADKIVGGGTLGLTGGTDDKDWILASPVKYDYIKLIGNGTTGWNVMEASGTWSVES